MRTTSRSFPMPPVEWDNSSREVWNSLIKTLEASELFDQGRRTRPTFIVTGSVSAATTLDISNPNVTALTHIVGRLLKALDRSPYIDYR